MSPPDFSEADKRYMVLALELAEQGRYTTTPNPCVGAVIVLEDRVVGQGWHHKAGEAHAEVIALSQAGEQSRNATVYATLEPCSFTGRTGPCADALVKAGVKRVVYAMQDPHTKVAGSGADKLRKAGIQVDEGLMPEQALALNRGYIKRMRCGEPFVRVKIASSLDGRSAMANGESQWITGESSRNHAQRLRAESCAILTGVDTILFDDPSYSLREQALGSAIERQPDLWICDSLLRSEPTLNVFKSIKQLGRKVVIVAGKRGISENAERAKRLGELGAKIISCDLNAGGQIDLDALLAEAGKQELNVLLVEAGPRLTASFLKQKRVDEIIWYIAPKILGADARPVVDLSIEHLSDALEWNIVEYHHIDGDICLTVKPT